MANQTSRRSPFKLIRCSAIETGALAGAYELAKDQSVISITPPGHISVEPRERGGHYATWVRYDAAGKRTTREHIGPEGSEQHMEAVARLDDLKTMQHQAKTLRAMGFVAIEHDAALVVAQFHNKGVFTGGGVLIGTRAFGSLLNQLGWHATPHLPTADVDLARPRALSLAAPLGKDGFFSMLKDTGLRFLPVEGLSRPPDPPTSFKVQGKPMKVDVLVPNRRNAMPYASVALPELGTHATSLPFLNYLLDDSMPSMAIGRDHLVPILVPRPGRYALHKLLVADLRAGTDNPKIEKDLIQAGILAAILEQDDQDELATAASALTAAMKRHLHRSLPRWFTMLSDHPAAADLVDRLCR